MNEISGIYAIAPFTAGKSTAPAGYRIAKVGYKITEKQKAAGKTAKQSVCASVPMFTATAEDLLAHATALLPHVTALIQSAQDAIVKSLHESGKTEIRADQITIASCLQFLLEAEAESGRLTIDAVNQWCESSGLADALRLRLNDVLGFGDSPNAEQAATVERQLDEYKAKFAGMSGGRTMYAPEIAKRLLRALELADLIDSDADRIAQAFTKKLTDWANPRLDGLSIDI